MGSLFESRLRTRATTFVNALGRAGVKGVIVEDSFRDYSVKIAVSVEGREFGHVNLYFSSKANTFSMRVHELKDKSIVPLLEAHWADDPPAADESPHRGWQMYVDGSCMNGATGYGAVILKDGEPVAELSGPVDAAEVSGTRQVAGELRAVEEGLAWCRENDVRDVEIFFDYYGVEKWATGAWKTNQPLTRGYAERVGAAAVRIRWRKVAAHSGNRWNDRADALAKRGALERFDASGATIEDSGVQSGLEPGTPGGGLTADLLEKKERFLEYLMVNGVEAAFDRVYNDQFARLIILDENEKRLGLIDLYHTRRKPFSPYLHGFKDENLKNRIANLWRNFISASG